MLTINRNFAHRTFGDIGACALSADVKSMALDGNALPDASVAYLLRFALQSLQDAYAGAKSADEAQASWAKKRDALIAGTIGERGSGEGVSERQRVQRQIARVALKAKLGGTSPEWKDFTGLADAEQAERLDAIYAKNEAKLGPAVDEKLAQLAAEREARKGLADDLDL